MTVLLRIDRAAVFVLGVSLLVASILLVGAQTIAPPLFDPVGSAALPRACAVALIGIGVSTFVQSFLRKSEEGVPTTTVFRLATVGTMILMTVYILSMQLGFGFVLPTVAFVAAAVPLVSASFKVIPIGIALALVLGFGAEWLFTEVFFVDLPVMK